MNKPLEEEIREALNQQRESKFAPGFEDRALARWNRERVQPPSILAHIESRALRFVPIAIAASLLLAINTVRRGGDDAMGSGSMIERVLGWQGASSPEVQRPNSMTYEGLYAELYALPQLSGAGGVR